MPSFLIIFFARYLIYLLFLSLIPLWKKHCTKTVLKAGASIILAFSISELIKHFFFVPRPFAVHNASPLFPQEPDGSFPSSHSAAASALAASVFTANKKLGILLFFGTLTVGLGRVLSLVHSPLDILAGLIIGIIIVLVFNSIFPYLLKIGRRKK